MADSFNVRPSISSSQYLTAASVLPDNAIPKNSLLVIIISPALIRPKLPVPKHFSHPGPRINTWFNPNSPNASRTLLYAGCSGCSDSGCLQLGHNFLNNRIDTKPRIIVSSFNLNGSTPISNNLVNADIAEFACNVVH